MPAGKFGIYSKSISLYTKFSRRHPCVVVMSPAGCHKTEVWLYITLISSASSIWSSAKGRISFKTREIIMSSPFDSCIAKVFYNDFWFATFKEYIDSVGYPGGSGVGRRVELEGGTSPKTEFLASSKFFLDTLLYIDSLDFHDTVLDKIPQV